MTSAYRAAPARALSQAAAWVYMHIYIMYNVHVWHGPFIAIRLLEQERLKFILVLKTCRIKKENIFEIENIIERLLK